MNNASSPTEKKRKHVAEYELGRTLGQGAFGKVKLGTNVFTGEQVAVKIISGDQARSKKDIMQLEREVSFTRSLLLLLFLMLSAKYSDQDEASKHREPNQSC